MKKKLLIIGASGHGKVVADIAMKMNKWEVIEFMDDSPKANTVLGLNIVGNYQHINEYLTDYDFFVGIGNNKVRKSLLEQLEEKGVTIPILIHPSAVIGQDVDVKKGTVIMAGAVINPSTKIGKGCIINTGSTIDHDNRIGDYTHISPGANLAGSVNIEENSWIGVGGVVSNNVNITSNCTIGAGGVVIENLTKQGIYVGVPVRRLT